MVINTLKDALELGYTNGDVRWHRGYVSRKSDLMALPVYMSDDGKNKLYMLLPTWSSTSRCVKMHLIPPEQQRDEQRALTVAERERIIRRVALFS